MKIVKPLKILYTLILIVIGFVNLSAALFLFGNATDYAVYLIVGVGLLLLADIGSFLKIKWTSFISFMLSLSGGVIIAVMGKIMSGKMEDFSALRQFLSHTSALILPLILLIVFLIVSHNNRKKNRIDFSKTEKDEENSILKDFSVFAEKSSEAAKED